MYAASGSTIRVYKHSSTATPASVKKGRMGVQLKIYPNPSNGETYAFMEDPAPFIKLGIYSMNGLLVYEGQISANVNFQLPELEAGVYYIKMTGSKGAVCKKLVRY